MAYNLQRTTTSFKSGKNILASEHVRFVEAGVTIKGGEGALVCGQALARGNATHPTPGKWVKYVDADNTAGKYDDFGILNVDADATTYDCIVGEVIVAGAVYDAKLVGVAGAFKTKTPLIRYVTHL